MKYDFIDKKSDSMGTLDLVKYKGGPLDYESLILRLGQCLALRTKSQTD